MPRRLPRILVIDDHKFTLDAVTDILMDEECYDVYSYLFLPRLEFIRILNPDVILLDVILQHSDGRHICQILRNDPCFSQTQIVLFSAYLDSGSSVIEAGANAFLRKPFDIDDLLCLISKCVSERMQKNSSA